MNNDKIILFVHFHKAGGTSINHMFYKDYKHYEPNKNGNPYFDEETIIDFWNYNTEEFNIFKNDLRLKKVNFIAMEWNFFKYDVDLSDLNLLICFREPYDRFISAFNKDNRTSAIAYQKENIGCGKYINKVDFYLNYNKNNYYVKMLNGLGNSPDISIELHHLENACRILDKFQDIIILEKPQTFEKLKKYNIDNIIKHNVSNKTKINGGIDREYFMRRNLYDYLLYDYACKLALRNT